VPGRARVQRVLALNLTRGHAVLGRAHLEHDHDPSANGDLGGVDDRASQDRELLTAGVATPDTTLRLTTARSGARNAVLRHDVVNVRAGALGALGLAVPAQFLQVQVSVGPVTISRLRLAIVVFMYPL